MKSISRFLPVLFTFLILVSCSEDDPLPTPINTDDDDVQVDEPDPNPDPPVSNGQSLVKGFIDLPDNINPESLTVVSPVGDFEVDGNGNFKALASEMDKSVLMVEDQDGEILLAALNASPTDTLNDKSTTRAIVGLAPWSGLVGKEEFESILEEFSLTAQYKNLENAVSVAIGNGKSPLLDQDVLDMLEILFTQEPINSRLEARVSSVPEVDNLVEPVITYANGSFSIANDGTTTSVWGFEFFNKDKESLTDGALMLEGNKVFFPSLGSIWKFITGNALDAVFELSDPLIVPAQVEDKYEIQFASPTRYTLNPNASFEAAKYNIYNSYSIIFKAIGIDLSDNLNGLKPSDYFDQGCFNEAFNSTTTVLAELLVKQELTTVSLLNKVGELFKGSVNSITDCIFILKAFPGGKTEAAKKFVKGLGKFLKAYEKVEAAFVTGKLLGDMALLNDIQLCRQVINGKIYPCFTLVKPDDYPTKVTQGEEVQFYVNSKLDIKPEEQNVVAKDAPVFWEIIEGPRTGAGAETQLNSKGNSGVSYTAKDDELGMVKLRAAVKDKNGKVKDEVIYDFEILPVEVDSVNLYAGAVAGIWDVIINPDTDNEKYYRMSILKYYSWSPAIGGTYWSTGGPNGSDPSTIKKYYENMAIIKKDGRYFLYENFIFSNVPQDPLTFPPKTFNAYDSDGKIIRTYTKVSN